MKYTMKMMTKKTEFGKVFNIELEENIQSVGEFFRNVEFITSVLNSPEICLPVMVEISDEDGKLMGYINKPDYENIDGMKHCNGRGSSVQTIKYWYRRHKITEQETREIIEKIMK